MSDKQDVTKEQAKALLEADTQRRVKAAAEAIQAVLQEHECDLVAVPQIVEGRIVAAVQIVAR
jgi:hypothetical protein